MEQPALPHPPTHQVLDGNREFSEWCSTLEGINIVGGFAKYRGVSVFVKRCTNKRDACTMVMADALLDLFAPLRTIGSFMARIKFDSPVVVKRPPGLGRGDVTLGESSKPEWYFVQSRLPGALSVHQYVVALYDHFHGDQKLWLPGLERDEHLMKRFTEAFLYRMIIGATDPGPTNFLWRADGSVFPIDMGSALSKKLDPDLGINKPWLTANLAGKRGIRQLAEMRPYAREIAQTWRSTVSILAIADRLKRVCPYASVKWINGATSYVLKNLERIETDFEYMIDHKKYREDSPEDDNKAASKKRRGGEVQARCAVCWTEQSTPCRNCKQVTNRD